MNTERLRAAVREVRPLGYVTDMGGTVHEERLTVVRRSVASEDGMPKSQHDVEATHLLQIVLEELA